MRLDERIDAFAKLSEFLTALVQQDAELVPSGLEKSYEYFNGLWDVIYAHNGWFEKRFVLNQLDSIAQATTEENLRKWLEAYNLNEPAEPKNVAVIMAGNVPFVGFSDFIAVLITGNNFIGKLSSKDKILPVAVAKVLIEIEPRFEQSITFTDGFLNNYDAVIATGSDNSARYFERYFAAVPHIIRRNRTSVALLSGDETEQMLSGLSKDIFLYFGLGCRNVSKLYLPEGFDLDRLFNAFYQWHEIGLNNKYANNYEYNRAIYLMNGDKFLDNGFVILKESLDLVSPTAVVYYQFYKDWHKLPAYIEPFKEKIQCVVSARELEEINRVEFGQAQFPQLWEYPDNVDVVEFLNGL